MASSFQPPDRITIPAPMPTVRQRGINATGDLYGRNIKVRVSIPERKSVELAAERLDMSMAAFIRWCATRVATQINDSFDAENPSE